MKAQAGAMNPMKRIRGASRHGRRLLSWPATSAYVNGAQLLVDGGFFRTSERRHPSPDSSTGRRRRLFLKKYGERLAATFPNAPNSRGSRTR